MKYGRVHGNLEITNNLSDRLLRLPLWPAMNPDLVVQVIAGVGAYF
jgi:dTDP-4-amino-4,6-dideoxygalactose transaminase